MDLQVFQGQLCGDGVMAVTTGLRRCWDVPVGNIEDLRMNSLGFLDGQRIDEVDMATKQPLGRSPNIHRTFYLKGVLACQRPQPFEKMDKAAKRPFESTQNLHRSFILDVGLAFRRPQTFEKGGYIYDIFIDGHYTTTGTFPQ
ncbi:hypothetical protein K439DRAFT_1623976 [Ramaria rubella]|nr:hypothetical protein K439DRAFT_1623976 [Ramaria rubella]